MRAVRSSSWAPPALQTQNTALAQHHIRLPDTVLPKGADRPRGVTAITQLDPPLTQALLGRVRLTAGAV